MEHRHSDKHLSYSRELHSSLRVQTNMMEPELTRGELHRYARHIALPEVGLEGQARLKSGRVLCVGAGGLGLSLIHI